MKRFYVGLATTFHEPALAIVNSDGELLFAEATERFLQNKRAIASPADNLLLVPKLLEEYCAADADYVVATTWSAGHFRLMKLASALGFFRFDKVRDAGLRVNRSLVAKSAELGLASLHYAAERTAGMGVLHALLDRYRHARVEVRRFSHHLSHAAYACQASPFERAACMIVDGMGEFGAITSYRYEEGRIETLERRLGAESLGMLYGLVTTLCGFEVAKGEEWKVMGLAPYGSFDPEIYALFRSMYRIENGRLRFASERSLQRSVDELERKYFRKRDVPPIEAANLAAVGQYVFVEIMTELLEHLGRSHDFENLVLSGGCALNSSFNGMILERTPFRSLFVPSAPADDGNAVGAAYLAFRQDHPDWRPQPGFASPYTGSRLSREALENLVNLGGIQRLRHLPDTICQETAALLAQGKLVGWAQGRAEFGPRALGNRSILADPRPAEMKDHINARVKFREEFRPFAPSILHEHGPAFFSDYQESPYMERTLRFRPDVAHLVPAVVHENGSGRLQTVKREWNPRYYDLIEAFRRLTGIPLLLNTSFNIMGKPIIHSVEDAVGMFFTTGLDVLVLDDYLIEKAGP
jgi:carbamoyltransferase